MRSFFRRVAYGSTPTRPAEPVNPTPLSLASLQRDVSLIQAEFLGVQSHIGEFGSSPGAFTLSRRQKRELRNLIEDSAAPCLLIDPRPGLRIVDANEAFAHATLTKRSRIEGDMLFAALPGNMDDDSVAIAFEAYKLCAQSLQPYMLPLQRYDIRDAAGVVLRRHWRSSYLPIMDDAGRLAYILNRPVPIAAN